MTFLVRSVATRVDVPRVGSASAFVPFGFPVMRIFLNRLQPLMHVNNPISRAVLARQIKNSVHYRDFGPDKLLHIGNVSVSH